MSKKIIIVAGLGYGDEGKGKIVDSFAREFESPLVVRFGGGHQAGHNVVKPDGRWHCFAQFGSATFVAGARTFLSRGMCIEPNALLVENEWLKEKQVSDALDRLAVDRQCSVITPAHKMICQMKNIARGRKWFGSCGMGVGEAVFDRDAGRGIVIGDADDPSRLKFLLESLTARQLAVADQLLERFPSDEMQETYDYFSPRLDTEKLAQSYREFADKVALVNGDAYLRSALAGGRQIIMEGAQGALLDPIIGFQPYVTKTGSTFRAAERILAGQDLKQDEIERVGVLRAYMTRHGSGPLVTEDLSLASHLPEAHNCFNENQGEFRFGWFDLVASRYAIKASGQTDSLAFTNIDRLSGLYEIKVCVSYEYVGSDVSSLDNYFIWKKPADKIIIEAIKPDRLPAAALDDSRLADLLDQCRPYEWRSFDGWQEDISAATRMRELPSAALKYLSYLEGELGITRGYYSVSPEAKK